MRDNRNIINTFLLEKYGMKITFMSLLAASSGFITAVISRQAVVLQDSQGREWTTKMTTYQLYELLNQYPVTGNDIQMLTTRFERMADIHMLALPSV